MYLGAVKILIIYLLLCLVKLLIDYLPFVVVKLHVHEFIVQFRYPYIYKNSLNVRILFSC